MQDLSDTLEKYIMKIPKPLFKQFTDRMSKEDAIKCHKEGKAFDGHALFLLVNVFK